MARFPGETEREQLTAKRAKEKTKDRIWSEVVSTVPPEFQWHEYFQRICQL